MSSGGRSVGSSISRMMREQQLLKFLEQIVPQLMSDFAYLDSANPDGSPKIDGQKVERKIDELKMSVLNSPEEVYALTYFAHRAEYGHVRAAKMFVDMYERGSHAVGGFGAKQAESIAIGIFGKGKTMQKKGFVKRHITERGEGDFEDVEE